MHHAGAAGYAQLCGAASQLFPDATADRVFEINSMKSSKYI
jgi:hypothetical protein